MDCQMTRECEDGSLRCFRDDHSNIAAYSVPLAFSKQPPRRLQSVIILLFHLSLIILTTAIMGGCTAIVNKAVTGDKSVELFYGTENLQLGLALRTTDNSDANALKLFVSKSTDTRGNIKNPSRLGSAAYYGVNIVVGVTEGKSNNDGPSNDISIVSPVYRPLASTELVNNSVAICVNDKGTAGWVYYVAGASTNTFTIKEYRLDSFSASTAGGSTKVLEGTSLAAYFDPTTRKRFVIYQDSEKSGFYELNVEEKDTDNIQNSSDALSGTTIAVTTCNGVVYLYYTDRDYVLRRVDKKGGKWRRSDDLEASSKVGATSQLTVVTANGSNHVFYVADGDNEDIFTHYIDDISKSEE
ncbi:hypothetical protein MN608_10959 [Microdochium nivale]|nr:hypothetical protein MN608_10959 [Microdochium nivale]